MNYGKNNGHMDFTSHTSQETQCCLSPKHDSKGTAHYHAKADWFTKNCTKPSVDPSDSNKTFIGDSEIR